MLPKRSFIHCKDSTYFTLTMKSKNYLLVAKVISTIAPPMADIHIGEELRSVRHSGGIRFQHFSYKQESEAVINGNR
ncbi:MAG: hypothetical protein EZS28_035098, partial [Streblomastix strix]